MRAVVLEKDNNEFIVLAHDESMHSIPCRDGVEVGDVIELDAYLNRHSYSAARSTQLRRIAAYAAALMVAFFGVFSYMTFDVSATVTTDGEASIVYYLNHRGQVLKAEAINEEGEEVLEAMGGVSHRPKLDDVLKETEKAMQDKGYLGSDERLSYETDKDNDGKQDERKTLGGETSGSGSNGGNGASEKAGGSEKTGGSTAPDNAAPEKKEVGAGALGNKQPSAENGSASKNEPADIDKKGNNGGTQGGDKETPGGNDGSNPSGPDNGSRSDPGAGGTGGRDKPEGGQDGNSGSDKPAGDPNGSGADKPPEERN